VVLLLAAVLLGAPLIGVSLPGAGGDRSSLDRGPEGSAALAGVFRRLGYSVESLRTGLHGLDRRPAGTVLYMPAAPGLLPPPLMPGDVERIQRFLERGGTLVAAVSGPSPLLLGLGIEFDSRARPKPERGTGLADARALPLLPDPLVGSAPLAIRGRGGFPAARPPEEVLYAADGVPVALRVSRGEGRAILLADPYVGSNAGVGSGGNLDLHVAILGRYLAPSAPVLFDDLHAGAGDDAGVVAWARRAGFLPPLLLVVLLAVLYLWRAGVRFGAILPALDERAPRASIELVRAVASLFERAGLYPHSLAVVSRRFRRELARRSGGGSEPGRLERWVRDEFGAAAAADFDRIRRTLAELLSRADPKKDDVLSACLMVHEFERRWLVRRRPEPDPPRVPAPHAWRVRSP
jgi:hypothetical protein